MFGHHQKQLEGNQSAINYRKQQKHHKHMEQLGQLGTVATGAYAMHEKHKAKKDPEHARSHKIKEEIAAPVAVGIQTMSSPDTRGTKTLKRHPACPGKSRCQLQGCINNAGRE